MFVEISRDVHGGKRSSRLLAIGSGAQESGQARGTVSESLAWVKMRFLREGRTEGGTEERG